MVKLNLNIKIQIATISPLIIGIIICSTSSISIMFSEYITWLGSSRSDLLNQKMSHFNNVSNTFSDSFELLIDKITFSLLFISQNYEGALNGTLVKSAQPDRNYSRFELSNGRIYAELNLYNSVWFSSKLHDLNNLPSSELDALDVSDYFIRGAYNTLSLYIKNRKEGSYQLGLLLDNGLDFRYPAIDMKDILSCNKVYSPLDSKVYKSRSYRNINMMHECSYFSISFGFSQGAAVFYMYDPVFYDYLVDSFSDSSNQDLSVQISSADLSNVIITSTSQNYSNTSCEILFSTDQKLKSECEKTAVSSLNDTVNLTITGYNSVIIWSTTPLNFSLATESGNISNCGNFIISTFTNKRLVLEGLNNLIDDLLNIIIVQIAIFLVFIVISVYCTWKMSHVINTQIFSPLSVISHIMSGRASEDEIKGLYNREVNQLIEYLKLLNTFEHIINPQFLLHPNPHARIRNLLEAHQLHSRFKNYRGMAICKNLLGNMFFHLKNYEMAKISYQESLASTEKLYRKVLKIEKEQEGLNRSESMLLRKKTGRNKKSWDDQKMFLKESVNNRKEQILMLLESEVIYYSEENVLSRKRLKEINKYQLEILKYYISTRTHFFRMTKVLLGVSKVFEHLNYYHSGLQLLEIVKDELVKIKLGEVNELDVDVTRLRSIGINIKQDESERTTKHFLIENVTYEKDIFIQEMFYRKAMIQLKSDLVQQAAHSFTSAIEYGNYFDPQIRSLAITELKSLMNSCNIIDSAKDFQELEAALLSTEYSLLLVLVYEIEVELKLNFFLVNFFKFLDRIRYKIGVITDSRYANTQLDIYQRDMPCSDLEELFRSLKKQSKFFNLYDTIVSAKNAFTEDLCYKIAVCFFLSKDNSKGASKFKHVVETLQSGITFIVFYKPEALSSDLLSLFTEEQIISLNIDLFDDYELLAEKLKQILQVIHVNRQTIKTII